MRVKCPVTPVFGLGIVSKFHHCFSPDAEGMTVSGSQVCSQQRPSAGGSVILYEIESVLMSSLHSVAPEPFESQSGWWDPQGVLKDGAEPNQM